MIRLLTLPLLLLLLGFTVSAQTVGPRNAGLYRGQYRPTSTPKPVVERPGRYPMALIIVDGYLVESSALGTINPDQVEHVEVLKSQDAMARYGEKARGGALLISTKVPAKTGR